MWFKICLWLEPLLHHTPKTSSTLKVCYLNFRFFFFFFLGNCFLGNFEIMYVPTPELTDMNVNRDIMNIIKNCRSWSNNAVEFKVKNNSESQKFSILKHFNSQRAVQRQPCVHIKVGLQSGNIWTKYVNKTKSAYRAKIWYCTVCTQCYGYKSVGAQGYPFAWSCCCGNAITTKWILWSPFRLIRDYG